MLRNLRYIYFLMLSLLLFGCEKNNDFEYVNPSIRMVEVYLKEDNLCTLTLEIETGVGFSGHSAWIELYDITAGSSQPVKKPITLTEDAKQTHTLEFGAPVENHDFLVKGVLTTSKNRFETWGKYIYFSKKSHKYDFSNPYVYGDVAMLYGGEPFSIYLGLQGGGFKYDSLKVSLNDTLFLEYTALDSFYSGGDHIVAYLPENIASGDYSVQLYIDQERWDVQGAVRVFPWNTKLVEIQGNHPFSYYHIDASFNLGSTIVYVQSSKVWTYDIQQDSYLEKKELKLAECAPVAGVGMDGMGYVLMRSSGKLDLWSYDPKMDEWKYMAEYPGEAISNYTMFAMGGYVYIGAGHNVNSANVLFKCRDFWRYSIESCEWERMKDLPFDSGDEDYQDAVSSCVDNGIAYVFLYDRTLWRYQMDQDKWTQEETLRNGTSLRYSSALHVWNGKVCLIGGQTNYWTRFEDIQLYDPVSRQWSHVGKTRMYMDKDYIPVTFEKDNNIYLGPVHRWTATNSDSNSIPRYLKIIPQQ